MVHADASIDALIYLLKEYGIRHLVLSSGTRNLPFVSKVEVDDKFVCHSIIDERNAPFYALGIAQQLNEPVGLACTSGTAVPNYFSGLTEAFYSKVPLVAITFDRPPHVLNQLETQKMDQTGIFKQITNREVSLPLVKDEDDLRCCVRLINEALIDMGRRGKGPVHINVPLSGDTNTLNQDADLPVDSHHSIRKIQYVQSQDSSIWSVLANQLAAKHKVLIIAGQNIPDDRLPNSVRGFTSLTRFPVLMDNLANLRCNEMVMAQPVIKALNSKTLGKLSPDLVITFGNNFQERIKDILRTHRGEFEHWAISPDGEVHDVFGCQTALFDCEPADFFIRMTSLLSNDSQGFNGNYLHDLQEVERAASLPEEMPFSNFSVMRRFSEIIPSASILHLSILNSTRIMQFFKLDESITVTSNVNAFGIDGCLPTLIGQAAVTDKLAFLVIGDLSFFYAMNALSIKGISSNVRVLLINNGGGAEFHIQPDSDARPTIDWHIGAAHCRIAEGWARSCGFDYHAVNNERELEDGLARLIDAESKSPVFIEVFTGLSSDGQNCLNVYRALEKNIEPVVRKLSSHAI